MADLSDDQLRQLCAALGWQGGTFWQVLEAVKPRGWQPMSSAPKDGTEVLAWFPKLKLDEDDNPTSEVIGGAMAPVQWQGEVWMEPGWLEASGSYFFDDFCFADEPVLWHPMPPEPAWPLGVEGNGHHTTCHEPLMKDDPT